MILLDTNVLSALMRREPDAAVVDWLDTQPAESIWTTSLASRLLDVLIDHARTASIAELMGMTLAENRAAAKLLKRFGFTLAFSEGIYREYRLRLTQ